MPDNAKPSSGTWIPPVEFDGYRLGRLLGKGGMGAVYLGQDMLLERPVAIKFIRADQVSASSRALFLNEAHTAARLQHPNVVTIHRVGEIDGHPYIITEYVRGQSLDRCQEALPWRRVAEIGVALCRGLATAHRRGILHRDIKPSNVIEDSEGELKLLDFGIAKLISRPEDGVSAAAEAAATLQLAQSNLSQPVHRAGPQSETMQEVPELLRSARVAPPNAETMQGAPGSQPLLRAKDPSAETVPASPPQSPPAKRAAPQAATLAAVAPPGRQPVTAEAKQSSIKGTPSYMAPEVFRGEPASYRSDIYSMGAMLYELCAARPPFIELNMAKVVNENDAPPLAVVAPATDARFAAIVDRCLRRDPGQRFGSVDELRQAIEHLLLPSQQADIPEGNPYRGLLPFEAEHRALFFGRRNEVGTLIERLRSEPSLLVVADSGIGKSSLIRAGVLPTLTASALGDGRIWRCAIIVPGRQPRQALIDALSQLLGLQPQSLALELQGEPRRLGRRLGELLKPDQGAVLFVDQLEELITNSLESEAEWFAEAIASLSGQIRGFRLLMTARADFLSRLGALPGLGDEVNRAFYLLRPLSPDRVREVITGPARLKGVAFESEALVDELATAATKTDGGLPLLQFALAELWEARRGSVITHESLQSIGGVVGALARHADHVLSRLSGAQRETARRIFLALITAEGTRMRRTSDELCYRGAAVAEVLEALVRSRLLLARDTGEGPGFEVAHEALIRNWGTLQRWLEVHGERRAIRQRVEEATREWQRLGEKTEGLWSARQVLETDILESTDVGPRERRFLEACRLRARRLRVWKWTAVAIVPVVSALVYGGVRLVSWQNLQRRVSEIVEQGQQRARENQIANADVLATWQRAMDAYDSQKQKEGEALWLEYKKKDERRRVQGDQLIALLKTAQEMAPKRMDVRQTLATVWDQLASGAHNERRFERRDRYLKQLREYDESGRILGKWQEPAQVRITSTSSNAAARILRYDIKGKRYLTSDVRTLGSLSSDNLTLGAGSYLLSLTTAGSVLVHYPFVVEHGQSLTIALALPRAADIPAGFIYVPPGRFLFGAGGNDDEWRTNVYRTVPLHPVDVSAYLISRYETTYSEWIDYLKVRQREEKGFIPQIDPEKNGRAVSLKLGSDGQWQLELLINSRVHVARQDQPLVFGGRELRKQQDWMKLPVSGVSRYEAEDYVAWLSRSGRVPHARLCSELEWERAARGADDREYPPGDEMDPQDANYEDTYGEEGQEAGPDEVSSHEASRSPFGVDDMVGNIAEWTRSSLRPDQSIVRGGSFNSKRAVRRIPSRRLLDPDRRDGAVGIRVCADAPKT